MRAYSMDLRERVVEAAERKEGTHAELAVRFRVSVGWVKKMLSQWRRLGTLRPQTHRCGRKPRLSEADLARLAELVSWCGRTPTPRCPGCGIGWGSPAAWPRSGRRSSG